MLIGDEDKSGHNICECSRSRLSLTDVDTGECYVLPCNSWYCGVCAPRKRARLNRYISERLQEFSVVRLLTVTLRYDLSMSPELHYRLFQEIWRRSIIEIRRMPFFRGVKDVQYIKVNELFERGYVHFHLLISEFIHQPVLYKVMNRIARSVLGVGEDVGQLVSVNIKFVQDNRHFSNNPERNRRNVVRYLTKYYGGDVVKAEGKVDEWMVNVERVKGYLLKDFVDVDIMDSMEETARTTSYKRRPFKKFWSKSRGLANIQKPKVARKYLIMDMRSGVTTLNLFFRAYLRNNVIDEDSKYYEF